MKKYQIFSALGIVLIILTFISPVWWVALQSRQYPKAMYPAGIRIIFKYDGVYNGCAGVREREELAMNVDSDCLLEMNKINHFIGMYPIVQGKNDIDETGETVAYPIYAGESIPSDEIPVPLKVLDQILRNSMYFFGLFVLLLIFFIATPKKLNAWAAYIAGLVPVYFLALYTFYLYWYGHHLGLHGGGAFEGINEFMPTVFGEGKVAQFTTVSYPTYGFGLGVLAFIVIIIAVLLKKKELKTV